MVKKIDCRGLECPKPVVKTKQLLDEIDAGTVTVIVHNTTSRDNIRRFAKNQDYKVKVREKGGDYFLEITKKGQIKTKPAEAVQKEPSQTDRLPVQNTYVIFITTDLLGTGDEKLGAILMKAFLNTIWDSKPKPTKIIFMNNGVKLTTEGSEVLETLTLIDKDGIDIISCGTCLAYYELTDKLKVGLASNMYEIVSALLEAPKIVKI